MSRAAYLERYAQEPPAGAVFGADVSWFQASSDGETIDSGTLVEVWNDLKTWAQFVNIRCSYGGSGSDGAQEAHVRYADLTGYTGKLGGYHFVGAASSAAANANNYLAQAGALLQRFTHHMVDAEGTVASAAMLDEICDRIEQATQRPVLLYSNWSYLNQSGSTQRVSKLWLAHYASSRYAAWKAAPGSADLWQAPYTPDQLGYVNPAVWQYSSTSSMHGHLDLDMAVGWGAEAVLGGDAPATGRTFEHMTPEQEATVYKFAETGLQELFSGVAGSHPWADVWTAVQGADLRRVQQLAAAVNDALMLGTDTVNGASPILRLYAQSDETLKALAGLTTTLSAIKDELASLPTQGGSVDPDQVAASIEAHLLKWVRALLPDAI